jgi:hypothetical protein
MHQIVKGTQHWDQFVVLVMIFKRDFDGWCNRIHLCYVQFVVEECGFYHNDDFIIELCIWMALHILGNVNNVMSLKWYKGRSNIQVISISICCRNCKSQMFCATYWMFNYITTTCFFLCPTLICKYNFFLNN